ncbi:hypothetical protein [Chitinibacter sp. S2-10]|uniref:hypothetical protein n=1 Tax=Chitinibacter sp. S2-10 TaxID=3373597 RepID=UPI003977B6E3
MFAFRKTAVLLALIAAQLAVSVPAANAAEPLESITPECQQAFADLNRYIEQHSSTLSQTELETSQPADAIRLACDGRDIAYSLSITEIARRFIPPPPPSSSQFMSSEVEGVLTLALMIALIAASSSGVAVIGSGNGGLAINPLQ